MRLNFSSTLVLKYFTLFVLITVSTFSAFAQNSNDNILFVNYLGVPVYKMAEKAPEFKGGSSALTSFLTKNIKYPKQDDKSDITGTVFMSFVVEPDGSLTNLKVKRSLSNNFDTEAMRLVSMMPNWIPGKIAGKSVSTSYVLPIKFSVESAKEITEVDTKPQFKGGQEGLLNYIASNFGHYNEFLKRQTDGTTVAEFIVNANGKISDVKIIKSIDSYLDGEFISFMKLMPYWKPAILNGKAVPCYYTLPITIKTSINSNDGSLSSSVTSSGNILVGSSTYNSKASSATLSEFGIK